MKYVITLLLLTGNCDGNQNLRKLGDFFQIANPIAAYCLEARTNNGSGFIAHFAVSLALVGIGKYAGHKLHYPGSMRPDGTSYTGMPSGHTGSAWAAAAYTRDPFLYTTAILTGYSRILAKKHTILQVAASIIIVESIVGIKWLRFDNVRINANHQSLSVAWVL